jgi:hypothetical protein
MWFRHEMLIQTLDRVQNFLDKNREVMEGVITSAAHDRFSESRERMVEHMKTQDGQARSAHAGVETTRRLRTELIQMHIRPIAAVAKAELSDAGIAALTVPRRRGSTVALVATGYGMAEVAREHEASLLAGGLPSGFIEELLAATDALRESLSARKQTVGVRVAATAGLSNEARVATTRLRVLDTLVRKAVREKPLLEAWKSVSRITSRAKTSTPLVDTGGTDSAAAVGTTEAPAEGLKAA